MFKLSRKQIDAPRANRLLAVWHDHAAREGLSESQRDTLAEPVVQWLMAHHIEHPENLDFVMIASARSDGAFLTAEPIKEALEVSFGEDELVISAIRREVAAQVRSADR